MIVIDTNVACELMKPEPNQSVRRWTLAQAGTDLYTSAITLAETLFGFERLPSGQRKELLRSAHYSQIVDTRERLGQPIDGFDAQIAAICRTNDYALATRNTKDFEHTGIDLLDPWLDS